MKRADIASNIASYIGLLSGFPAGLVQVISQAYLNGADLSKTNLVGVMVTEEQLKNAKSLEYATIPDESIHTKESMG